MNLTDLDKNIEKIRNKTYSSLGNESHERIPDILLLQALATLRHSLIEEKALNYAVEKIDNEPEGGQ